MKKKLLNRFTACLIVLSMSGVGLVAQTLKHSYTFEDGTWSGTVLYDQVSSNPVNGTINGNDWEIKKGYFYNHNSNQSATNQGGYISFDGTALALNAYSSVIMEAYLTTSNDQNNPNKWSVLAYFGGAAGANSFLLQPEISGSNTKAGINNTKFALGAEASANQTHHYVAVLTPAKGKSETYPSGKAGSVKLYYDGALIQSTALDTTTYKTAVSALSTTYAQLGKGGWTDALFTQPLHEFNIYDGGSTDSASVNSFVAARYAVMNGKLSGITPDAGTLSPAFDGNIYNYGIIIPAATTSLTVGATAVSTNYTSVAGAGAYDVSGESGTITLKTSSTATPYTIYWRKAVNTPVLTHSYPFTDGTAKDVVGTDNGTLAGSATIANGLFTTSAANSFYSGNSQHISLPASSINIQNYPSVSFEVVGKTSTSVANFWCFFGNQTVGGQNSATGGVGTDYVFVHTKDLNVSSNINHNPWNLNSTYSGTALNDNKVHHVVGILTIDSLILYQDGVLKGKTLLSNVNRLFNIGSKVAYIGRSGYPGDANLMGSIGEFNIWKGQLTTATVASRAATYLKDASLSGISLSVGSLTFDPATTTYNVTVPVGTTSVVVGATATKDFATVTGTGTVTLDGSGNGISSLIVTSADGSITKTYTVNFGVPQPTVTVVGSPLGKMDEYTPRTFTVSGVNLTDDITLTAPSGFAVTPAVIAKNDANSKIVTVSYVGTSVFASGDIAIHSTGAADKLVGVRAAANSATFSPVEAKTNLVTDPFMSSLSAYSSSWGNGVGLLQDTALVYGGVYSAKVTGKRAGSLTYNLTGIWKTDTKYRLHAKVYTPDASTFNLYVSGWSGSTADLGANVSSTDISYTANATGTASTLTAGTWNDVDFTFVTGSSITSANQYLYFNNYAANSSGTSYIDNVELYELGTVTSVSEQVKDGLNVYSTNGKLMVASDLAVTVYNIQGMKVAERAASKSVFEIGLATGVYLVKSGGRVHKVLLR